LRLGHERLELAQALADLLVGGAELINNGHASGTADTIATTGNERLGPSVSSCSS
jgi:hypothetical protein